MKFAGYRWLSSGEAFCNRCESFCITLLKIRIGGLFRDHVSSVSRNADIANYLPAIEWLVGQRYVVGRLGDPALPPLDAPRMLDYAHGPQRSEGNDVDLVEHCDYCLGS